MSDQEAASSLNLQPTSSRSLRLISFLNKEKIKLRSKEVPLMGHVITSEGLKTNPEKIRAVQEMPTTTDVAGV